TLKYLRDYFLSQDPKSVRICTLLDKPSRRTADVRADYIGFTVDDLFIIGYGLDFDQKYRNLPYISYLDN
ncbi:phosphoribosyltransferase, partial [Emergencia timonensis]